MRDVAVGNAVYVAGVAGVASTATAATAAAPAVSATVLSNPQAAPDFIQGAVLPGPPPPSLAGYAGFELREAVKKVGKSTGR